MTIRWNIHSHTGRAIAVGLSLTQALAASSRARREHRGIRLVFTSVRLRGAA